MIRGSTDLITENKKRLKYRKLTNDGRLKRKMSSSAVADLMVSSRTSHLFVPHVFFCRKWRPDCRGFPYQCDETGHLILGSLRSSAMRHRLKYLNLVFAEFRVLLVLVSLSFTKEPILLTHSRCSKKASFVVMYSLLSLSQFTVPDVLQFIWLFACLSATTPSDPRLKPSDQPK